MRNLVFGLLLIVSFFYISNADSLTLFDLREMIEEAKMNNPEIQAAKEKYEASKKLISPFRYLMDPWFGVEFQGNMRMYSLSQEFPFPAKLSSNSKLAKIEAEKTFEEYRKKEQEVIRKVKNSYARLFLIDKEIDVMKEVRGFLNQILKVAIYNYSLNKTPQSDVLRTQVELAKIDNELFSLTDKKSVIMSELNFLLNRPEDSMIDGVKEIEIKDSIFELEGLNRIAKESNPELKSFRAAIKKAKTSLSLSKQEYLPNFMGKFEQKEMDSKLSDRKFMFGLTLPIWFLGKQNKMVGEMSAALKMAEAEYVAMENMVFAEIKEAKIMVDKYKRVIELYKNSILPQLEATLKSSLKAYEVNQVDFITLLDSCIITNYNHVVLISRLLLILYLDRCV